MFYQSISKETVFEALQTPAIDSGLNIIDAVRITLHREDQPTVQSLGSLGLRQLQRPFCFTRCLSHFSVQTGNTLRVYKNGNQPNLELAFEVSHTW